MEHEHLLKEILKVTKENNEMLSSINTQRRLANFAYFIKWIVIIGVLYGIYQASIPYVQQANSAINQINDFTQNPASKIQDSFIKKLMGN